MQRREFLRWLCKVTGGLVAIGVVSELPPLRKINAAMFSSKAYALVCAPEGCSPDACSVQDSCSGKDYCATADSCQVDQTSVCQIDKCKLDLQNIEGCQYEYINCQTDICTVDKSGDCNIDLCRIDMTSGCTYSDVCATDNCTDGDTCSNDLPPCEGSETEKNAMNHRATRRDFAKAGINKAMQMLYKLCTVVLFLGLAYGQSQAATVIDARDAVFNPVPTFNTNQNFATLADLGPFLRDCDNDGILEADTNCDNSCTGDPEIRDYNNDGSYELPPGTTFEGSCSFSCFFIPYNVSITTTDTLDIAASNDIVVFGAMNLTGGGTFNAIQMIDLRTSAWNSTGPITFNTASPGTVDTSVTPVPPGGELPTPIHLGGCGDPLNIPTMNEWGMIIFMLLAGTGAVLYLRRQKRAAK
jgi:hypothetical protein